MLKFKWEIKFIKGKIQAKRGRPRKSEKPLNNNARWRQKLEKYQSDTFKKEGTAKIYVNFETNKLSMRAGSKKWMTQLLTPLFKIFKGKNAFLVEYEYLPLTNLTGCPLYNYLMKDNNKDIEVIFLTINFVKN